MTGALSEGLPEPSQPLHVGRIRYVFLVIVVALGLLVWLYQQSQRVDMVEHQRYVSVLHSLLGANARIDAEVLAGRLELSRNYDTLVKEVSALQAKADQLSALPSFIAAQHRPGLEEKLALLQAALAEKSRQVDLFQRDNAILRNSMAYMQQISRQMLDAQAVGEQRRLLADYVNALLFFARTPDASNREQLQQARSAVTALQETVDLLPDVLLHGDLISRHQTALDEQIRAILSLQTIAAIEAVETAYQAAFSFARQQAEVYRGSLLLLAIVITTLLALLFFHLVQTRRRLVRAHHEMLAHINAQKQAESRLVLHDTAFNSAHEGITLTDAKGIVLEVNPAFSRITGYRREEVIGKNPKVLKSGRHDAEFYRKMWDSIRETGNWRGEIWNRNKYGEIYPEMLSITAVYDEQGDISNYVAVFSDISRIKEQEARLKKLAHYDPLTNLPNRMLLIDRIDQAIAASRREAVSLAVIFMDLDGFKAVNDTFGHRAGDDLLMEIANRFKGALRASDTVARLGGDEFVFLLTGLGDTMECDQTVNRLLRAASQSFYIQGQAISLTASMGITFFPGDAENADALVRHADQAMYQAKNRGKNCYVVFDPEKDYRERDHNERIAGLEEALQKAELVLYYQPKADLRSGRVIGLEALLRWQHPQRGVLLPSDFLPLVEEHELGARIGYEVLRQALHHMQQWHADGWKISVSVNISGWQLQQPDFVEKLRGILMDFPEVDPQYLEIEVLETAALEDILAVSRVIEECQQLGVGVALDDFGTGYSSLTYLKRLPAKTLKIDMSFVRDMLIDPESLAIVHGIMGLAIAFQREVVAEGVESIEHGRMLMQLGCYTIQGYVLSKAMPYARVKSWSENWQPAPEWQKISHLYWDDNDYPMLAAEVEHQRWISRLLHALENDLPMPHRHIDDAHQCRFGQWYDQHGTMRYSNNPAFTKIQRPHQRVHELAAEIDRKVQQGDREAAMVLIPDILAQRDEIISLLEALTMDVAHADIAELDDDSGKDVSAAGPS